jgi:hypothetical protein
MAGLEEQQHAFKALITPKKILLLILLASSATIGQRLTKR